MAASGISRSARGYCFISVLEAMLTYSVEDGLTEEAVVAKLRAQTSYSLFVHSSLKNNLSGSSRWGEFGEGGLLWGECCGKDFEWFDGDSITQLLSKVRELYGLDLEQSFRNVTMPFEKKPRPLDLGTATHIGVIPTERIPSLLKVLLREDTGGLCERYLKDLLLNPPPFQIASSINAACRLMNNATCAFPDFTCVPATKLAKLIKAEEANHMDFLRIFNMTSDILDMYEKHELKVIIEKLLDPTWMATGLKYNIEALVSESSEIACAIEDKIVIEAKHMEAVTSFEFIPVEFFRDKESSWKGRVKRVHAENVFREVDDAAKALYLSVKEDFLPIVLRSPQGEIAYAKDHESVWFKGKRLTPLTRANTPGEEQIKNLMPAVDAKGRKVEVEWYTTKRVEEALNRYREAVVQAKLKVTKILRELAAQLQLKMNTIIFLSVLSVITKTLFCHAREGRMRNWVFPTLNDTNQSSSVIKSGKVGMQLEIVGLVPYWFNNEQENPIRNTIQMQSLFLLTGPNGGGKSSILRSIGATALLGICGLMVPAEIAIIPEFDSILLHMGSYDSPADHKSSFQMEMSEMRSVLCEATDRTLVLIDEICRGTEIRKGTCIAASMIEELDSIGCIGIVSTHLHGLLDVQLNASHILYKAMGTKEIDGHIKPTWKLIDGVCRESLAFETARCEGIPEKIIRRAEQHYSSLKQDNTVGITNKSRSLTNGIPYSERPVTTVEVSDTKGSYQSERNIRLLKEAQKAFSSTCEENLLKLHSCTLIKAREQPPPTLTNSSCVYILQRPDGRFYVGETDNLAGRISAHRSVKGMQTVPFLYSRVPGKSIARKLETVLINKLRRLGFELVNKADHSHQNFGTDYWTSDSPPF